MPILIKVFEFFIFFKIVKLGSIISHFDKTFGMLEKYENLAYVLRIILLLVLNSHFLAILYHSISMIDIFYIHSEEKNPLSVPWVSEAGIIDESCWIRYLHSFHFACKSLLADNVY